MTRQAHWVKGNAQERIPSRMIAFDTESRSKRNGDVETQTWRVGCAIRWRTDLKTGDHAEAYVFNTAYELWCWVSDYCRKGTRTAIWAHNLSHDVRISEAFTILPTLGFTLEWCNLDQSVSSATWRSDHGTLVMCDTYTWVPLPLSEAALEVGLVKFGMPKQTDSDEIWAPYCMRDTQIVYRMVSEITAFIRDNHLGNWQPTGAGMAYAMWRHRFLDDKVLVHDDETALSAERSAMYTGRAEAWKHGKYSGPVWTEVDLRNAYVTIAGECDVPRKLHYRCNKLSRSQFDRLAAKYRVLCRCTVRTWLPVLPYRQGTQTLWPVGEFTGWYWDTEVQCALRYDAEVTIHEAYVYARGPILQRWANWTLATVHDETGATPLIVRKWLKHCSRALIGRLALRTKSWELYGDNPEGMTGISHITDVETRTTRRLMHVGDQTFIETDPSETENSCPMITGWIMAECRVRLWQAMHAAGLANLAHVDTDALLVNAAGLGRLRDAYGASWGRSWQVKGSWRTIDLRGPRNYYRGKERVISGIPRNAEMTGADTFAGEKWASLANDLETRGDGVVTTWAETWHAKSIDPRRQDTPGVDGETEPYVVGVSSASIMSEAPSDASGE